MIRSIKQQQHIIFFSIPALLSPHNATPAHFRSPSSYMICRQDLLFYPSVYLLPPLLPSLLFPSSYQSKPFPPFTTSLPGLFENPPPHETMFKQTSLYSQPPSPVLHSILFLANEWIHPPPCPPPPLPISRSTVVSKTGLSLNMSQPPAACPSKQIYSRWGPPGRLSPMLVGTQLPQR